MSVLTVRRMTATEEIIKAIIGLAGTLLGGLIVYITSRRKNDADAANAVIDAAVSLIDPLKTRLGELEERVSSQEKEVSKLRRQLIRYGDRVIVLMRGIAVLIKQIGDLGEKPCWEPDKWSIDDDHG